MAEHYDVFFDYVNQLITIPEHDKNLVRNHFVLRHYKKDDFISKAGHVPRYHNFIVSGHVRMYHINENGEEVTTDFNDGPRFFTSFQAYATETVSQDNLECVTDCTLLSILKSDADKTAELGITQKDYSIKVLEMYLAMSKQRILDMSSLTAEQRYLKLLKNRPSLFQIYSLKHIASYLGIKAESLSRIRRELSKK